MITLSIGRALRVLGGLVPALLLAACAGKPTVPPVPEAALHPRTVAIIPVLRSDDLTINRRSPLVFVNIVALGLERIDRFQKQKVFEQRLEFDRALVARQLTTSLQAAAQKRGFDAVVLDMITRDPEEPEDFDYPRIDSDADVVIHVRISDIGLHNKMTSLDYEPYIDASARIVARASAYPMLDESFYYGVNGSPKDPYSVMSDPIDRWSSFETVMNKSDEVERSWLKGADALAALIVSKLPAPTKAP